MITLIGPAAGGVAHVSRCLAETWPQSAEPLRLIAVSDDGPVQTAGCDCPPAPGRARRGGATALAAVRAAWGHRACLRTSTSLHLELGRVSLGAFWFGLAAAVIAPRAALVVTTHDIPTVVLHPAAALVRRAPGLRDRLAYRVLAPLLDRPVLAALRRRAAATVVLSAAAATAAEAQSWPRVTRVDHGAAPQTRPVLEPGEAGYVLLAGYLGPGKGLDVLADAWARIASPLPLVIAGGHSEQHRDWVARIRHQLDTGPQPPSWTGYVDDAGFDRLVRESAVVVIPYEVSNPASGVLVRALVEGRAVVGTRVAAVVEEVVDDQNGLLVDPGDPVQLAEALARLTSSVADRNRLGREAARSAAVRHSWSTHTGELLRLHRDLVPSPSTPIRSPHHV